jgi:hypothetical protein
MNSLVRVFLIACLALEGQVPLDESDRVGTLELFVVDAAGRPVDARTARVSVQEVVDGRVGPAQQIGLQSTLRYGTYKLTVLASAASRVDKPVRIRSRHQVVIITLFLAPIESPWKGNFVNGKLPATSLAGGCLHVRLSSPLAETEFADARALPSGEFTFLDVKPGKYVFLSIGETGVCEIIPTEVLPRREQELVLR